MKDSNRNRYNDALRHNRVFDGKPRQSKYAAKREAETRRIVERERHGERLVYDR